MSVVAILKTVDGEFEISRVLGAFGTVVYIIAAHVFVALEFKQSGRFDITAYCLAFPGGLAAAIGSIALSARVKDKVTPNANTVSDGS